MKIPFFLKPSNAASLSGFGSFIALDTSLVFLWIVEVCLACFSWMYLLQKGHIHLGFTYLDAQAVWGSDMASVTAGKIIVLAGCVSSSGNGKTTDSPESSLLWEEQTYLWWIVGIRFTQVWGSTTSACRWYKKQPLVFICLFHQDAWLLRMNFIIFFNIHHFQWQPKH